MAAFAKILKYSFCEKNTTFVPFFMLEEKHQKLNWKPWVGYDTKIIKI